MFILVVAVTAGGWTTSFEHGPFATKEMCETAGEKHLKNNPNARYTYCYRGNRASDYPLMVKDPTLELKRR